LKIQSKDIPSANGKGSLKNSRMKTNNEAKDYASEIFSLLFRFRNYTLHFN